MTSKRLSNPLIHLSPGACVGPVRDTFVLPPDRFQRADNDALELDYLIKRDCNLQQQPMAKRALASKAFALFPNLLPVSHSKVLYSRSLFSCQLFILSLITSDERSKNIRP